MFPVLVAIPLLVILVAAALFGEMSPLLLGPCYTMSVLLLWMLIIYWTIMFLIEDSRELN